MFKFLIIAGGLFYLYRLVMKPNTELESTDHNEEILDSNNDDIDDNGNDDLEYTDYEEIE